MDRHRPAVFAGVLAVLALATPARAHGGGAAGSNCRRVRVAAGGGRVPDGGPGPGSRLPGPSAMTGLLALTGGGLAAARRFREAPPATRAA